MFRSIERLSGFGVFQSYIKPTGMHLFSDRNIIYGWNYSGKTTLSRLFATMEARKPNEDFATSRFSVAVEGADAVTDESLGTCSVTVRVFNSDFVERNLRFDGGTFSPILLLGEESVASQLRIARYEKVAATFSAKAHAKRKQALLDEQNLQSAKTTEAKHIKELAPLV